MSIVHLGAGEVSLCRRRQVVPTAPAGQSRSRVQTSRATRSRDRTLSHMLKINVTKPVSKPKATSSSTLVNLRPAGGVWTPPPPPCGSSRIPRKRRRTAPPDFHLPHPHLFRNVCESFNFWVMRGQVTRSGQVHCKLILTRVSFKTTSPCQKCKSMGRQNIIIVLWLDVSTRKMSSHHQHLVVD